MARESANDCGPTANLQKAATALGMRLSDEVTLYNDERTIPILGEDPRWVKSQIAEIACDSEIGKLAKRCQPENRGKPTHRKDLVQTLLEGIDLTATKAYARKKGTEAKRQK